MKVLKWAVVLLMAVLGLMAGASALASAAPDTQADMIYLHLLDKNGVSCFCRLLSRLERGPSTTDDPTR